VVERACPETARDAGGKDGCGDTRATVVCREDKCEPEPEGRVKGEFMEDPRSFGFTRSVEAIIRRV
jgi:hypothetical protein